MAFSKKKKAPSQPVVNGYLYEMHQHTSPCSACADVDPVEVVRRLKAEGYAGMVLTNHFYHGNTGIRRGQLWQDFVRPYEEDYLRAKAEGERLDFDVLFGVEEVVMGSGYKEVLLYGITPAFLYTHPELQEGGTEADHLARLSALVHQEGGVVFQAHPFRVRDYIARPWEELDGRYLDGIEAYNACNSPMENARAVAMAEQKGLAVIAGSDAHAARQEVRYGVRFPQRVRTEQQLAAALKHGAYELYLDE